MITGFSLETVMLIITEGQGFSYIRVVKRVKFISDRMLYIILRCHW
jgi:hypothetical protein